MFAAFPRRYSRVVSTAILLVGGLNDSHAHNLRLSGEGGTDSKSSSMATSNLDIEGEGVHSEFKARGGTIQNSSTTYERSRSTMLREEEMEREDVVEPNEFINDESLVHVSFMIVLL
jgi:hypothetical protein